MQPNSSVSSTAVSGTGCLQDNWDCVHCKWDGAQISRKLWLILFRCCCANTSCVKKTQVCGQMVRLKREGFLCSGRHKQCQQAVVRRLLLKEWLPYTDGSAVTNTGMPWTCVTYWCRCSRNITNYRFLLTMRNSLQNLSCLLTCCLSCNQGWNSKPREGQK